MQHIADGVVEEEQRHAAQALEAGAKVLAVGQHALHALRIAPPAHVPFTLAGPSAGGQVHTPAGAPYGGAVHSQSAADDVLLLGSAQQFRYRGPWVTLLLGAQKLDQPLAESQGGFGARAAAQLQGHEVALQVGGAPALQRAHADVHGPTIQMRMFSPGDLAHRLTERPAAQLQRFHLGEHRVAQQRLTGGSRRWTVWIVHVCEDNTATHPGGWLTFVGGGARLREPPAPCCSEPLEPGLRLLTQRLRRASQR